MKLIKRFIDAAFSVLKAFGRLILGEDEGLSKRALLISALIFIFICVFKSLNALAAAEREAAKRR